MTTTGFSPTIVPCSDSPCNDDVEPKPRIGDADGERDSDADDDDFAIDGGAFGDERGDAPLRGDLLPRGMKINSLSDACTYAYMHACEIYACEHDQVELSAKVEMRV
jgi:hypothetical protein